MERRGRNRKNILTRVGITAAAVVTAAELISCGGTKHTGDPDLKYNQPILVSAVIPKGELPANAKPYERTLFTKPHLNELKL